MKLHITPVLALLYEHHLSDRANNLTGFTAISMPYDPRKVRSEALLSCKGNFLPKYLTSAEEKDAIAYVAEKKCPGSEGLLVIIVDDEQEAVSLLGAVLCDCPQNDLFIIAITGTKGETVMAYFADHVLAQGTADHIALFPTLDRILGSKPEGELESDLTTPESLDLFHDMHAIVNNGMTHLVMEVSSQVYKKSRIHGLKYDIGIFLNISLDHIGRNKHPTFADHLHYKEQLLVSSAKCLINAETKKFTDVYYTAKATTQSENTFLLVWRGVNIESPDNAQIGSEYRDDLENLREDEFELTALTEKARQLSLDSCYKTSILGNYNKRNAIAAIIASGLAGMSANDAVETLNHIHIRGRAEVIDSNTHGTIYVDYVHSYVNLKRLLAFLKRQTSAGKIAVVLGVIGNKSISRRPGFGKALTEEQPDEIALTTDDPGFEDPMAIAREIDFYIDHDKIRHIQFEMNRKTMTKEVTDGSGDDDIVVFAGKDEDPCQKTNGEDIPYPTDVKIARDYINDLER